MPRSLTLSLEQRIENARAESKGNDGAHCPEPESGPRATIGLGARRRGSIPGRAAIFGTH